MRERIFKWSLQLVKWTSESNIRALFYVRTCTRITGFQSIATSGNLDTFWSYESDVVSMRANPRISLSGPWDLSLLASGSLYSLYFHVPLKGKNAHSFPASKERAKLFHFVPAPICWITLCNGIRMPSILTRRATFHEGCGAPPCSNKE